MCHQQTFVSLFNGFDSTGVDGCIEWIQQPESHLNEEQLERVEWSFCPACLQVAQQEGQGRLVIKGAAVA